MVMTLSSQPSTPGFHSRLELCEVITVCRNLEIDAQSYLFLLENLALQLGLGQRCQPEGIAIT